MNRVVLGALGALCLVGLGLFWWQGRAEVERAAPPPEAAPTRSGDPDALPSVASDDMVGLVGPAPPEATELSREQKRFGRYDRDSDGRITRNEMLSPRTEAFRKLDKDGNNLLTFEEWAVATVDKFDHADTNHDDWLTPAEFRRTAPPPSKPKPRCSCK
ncbi:EF-hand domain-containing protein [Novosphingobium sp. 1949]|uniref:EF-hand domain-containing protein n=1 Tax=Novosphingobium organovorum TaxID=2930092 RepID=A0ABT0B8R3_9SPHN|nr:EF-hand domain-containing protein [Novosphingobium organovorum]MCJ2181429.1 EF-hand domain-containing protein [Novosphingobium organovorum]